MNLYFTADLHFKHGNIIKYCKRPFLTEKENEMLALGQSFKPSRESVEKMDVHLLKNINATVNYDDTLYVLGDFCMPDRHNALYSAKKYRDQINCRNVHLIWGNHDDYAIRPLFNSCMDMCTVKHKGQSIVCLHYAMAIWNKSHRGAWHLYGHSHANAEANLDKLFPGRKSMDVGVDNAFKILGEYRPFSFEEIAKIMGKRTGSPIDHHLDN